MTDERKPGAQENDRTVDGPAALGEVLQLQEQLAARGSQVRQDAERVLDRAAALRADGDPRAGIAVSACRETLDAYQEAVDRSVRQACDAAGSTAASSAASPARPSTPSPVGGPSLRPAPPTATAIRHKVARLLAAAAVVGVLGLVGWGGLPSWSTVLATSPGHHAAPPDGPVATESPEVSTGADRAPRPEGRAGVVGRSDDRPAPADRPASVDLQHDDVRGLIASTLPGADGLSPSVATVADGLRAVGEAAASLATVGEALSSDDPSDDEATEAARSLLTDGVDAVDEAVDAAGDGAAGVDELDDGELLDVRSSEETEDGDSLDGVTDEGQQLWDGDEADGDRDAGEDGDVSENGEAREGRDDPALLEGDDRADASSADGVSEDAALDR